MTSSQPLFTNRLITEKSPYLLQHAHDPVDWYPWEEEAFKAAKEADKPIFLSIGYASCHWCHVMEHESFANLEIAKLMNETFINIKVDREEKPEVDSLYMEFAQAMMSGGAGWPLNVILTPDLMPFFAVTYLPADAKHGFLGLKQLVLRLHEIWQDLEERENVVEQAGKIVNLFESHIHAEGSVLPSKEAIAEAAELLFKTADPLHGGTRGAPKFPMGYQSCFLLRFSRKTGDSRALFYVEHTLEMMYRGGIYDHIGGGFSRYSVDERWLVPHFEKMLYDNAILARAYLETWSFTHLSFYREVAQDILNYLMRDMMSPEGAFYASEDADTEEREGHFYSWSWEEIHRILENDASLFCEFYGVTPTGNFEGRTLLHIPHTLTEFASHHHLDPIRLSNKFKELREKLFIERQKRVPPKKDDKIITSWNGLAIYLFAEAGLALHDTRYLDVARKAALFIREHLWQGEEIAKAESGKAHGGLYRRFRDGEAKFEGCLDDYAFLICGLISLFEADCGVEWLEFAMTLTSYLATHFKAPHGAFYLTNGRDPHLILRRCEFYDGAEPSGNAVHAENLIRLYQITGIKDYLLQAEDILKAAKQHIELYSPGACYHLMALQRYFDGEAPTLIVALNDEEKMRSEILQLFSGRFIPHRALIVRRDSDEQLRDLSSIARDKKPIDGKTSLYICHREDCQAPLTDMQAIWTAFDRL